MFCPNCGAKVANGTNFCPSCGKKIIQQEEKPVQKVETKTIEKKPAKSYNSELFAKPLNIFKSILIPVGIVACVFAFASILFANVSLMIGAGNQQPYSHLLNASRFIGITGWALLLVVFLLMLTHVVFQCIRLRSKNIKDELPGAILNGVIVTLLIAFFANLAGTLFDKYLFEAGANWNMLAPYWGIVIALTMYIVVYCAATKKVGSRLIQNLKALGSAILFSSIFAIIAIFVACFGGFYGNGVEVISSKILLQYAAFYLERFIVGLAGICSILALLGILFICLGVNNKKGGRIALWATFGGLMFVFFVVIAAMIKSNGLDGSWTTFYNSTYACTSLTIVNAILLLAGGITLHNSGRICLKQSQN